MPEILTYTFMQRAFVIGLLLALATACVGVVVVYRNLSMIGDALSHASLAGVALGLVAGLNPIYTATLVAVLGAFAIEFIRSRIPRYADLATAIVMSVGIGLAGILSSFTSAGNFNSYLFGSIVTVTTEEVLLVSVITAMVLLLFFSQYQALFFMSFDEEAATLSGIKTGRINFLFTLAEALTISVAARTVGTLVVTSLMVLPVASAMQLTRSYKQTTSWSMVLGTIYTLLGLTLSFYWNLKPGGAIVMTGFTGFMVMLAAGQVRKRRR